MTNQDAVSKLPFTEQQLEKSICQSEDGWIDITTTYERLSKFADIRHEMLEAAIVMAEMREIPAEVTVARWKAALSTTPAATPTKEVKEMLSDVDLMQTTDHYVWAHEFVGRYGGDVELMASWFASAMMAKHDKMVGPPNGDAMQYLADKAVAPTKEQVGPEPLDIEAIKRKWFTKGLHEGIRQYKELHAAPSEPQPQEPGTDEVRFREALESIADGEWTFDSCAQEHAKQVLFGNCPFCKQNRFQCQCAAAVRAEEKKTDAT